jgi:hypothetical protein
VKALVEPPAPAFARHMRDVVYVAITVGFFSLAGLFVRGCARIVGPDDASLGPDGHIGDDDVAAGVAEPMAARR